MIGWVQAGFASEASLPPERLTPEELAEIAGVVRERTAQAERLTALDHRLALLVTAARDRRGLVGPVRVHALSGEIQTVSEGGDS